MNYDLHYAGPFRKSSVSAEAKKKIDSQLGVFEASLGVFKGVDVLKKSQIESGDFAEQTVYPYERFKTIKRNRIQLMACETAMWLTIN